MKKRVTILIFAILFLPFAVLAAMGSSNYSIDSDTINSGGTPSDSANYSSTGTMGEQAIGESGSANYGVGAGFWHMGKTGLGLSCAAANVYMVDYTLGNANNYSKYLFSGSEQCTVTVGSATPWSLTASSTNMTSTKNNLSNTYVQLSTDGIPGTADTITSPTPAGISEHLSGQYSLNSAQWIIQGDATATGTFNNRPTLELTNLNGLYNESISGTITITLQ